MGEKLTSHALDWDLSAADVLRMMRHDDNLVALLGTWAGGNDIIASVPVITCHDVSEMCADFPDQQGLREREPKFGGGWIGFLGYGASSEFLPVPPAPGGPRRLPASWWGFYDHVLRRDRATGQWFFEALALDGRERAVAARLARLRQRAAGALPAPSGPGRAAGEREYALGAFTLTPSPAEHRRAVARTVEYIRQGDIFQANICLRLQAEFAGDPLDAFCAATTRLDPPYAAFLRLPGGAALASLSPELFLKRTGDRVQSSPIKGTRLRPPDPVAAELSRQELASSAKDGPENVMIVDLMRNDLSRVCVPGTVRVPALLRPEPHPGIWHLVSDVVGKLLPVADDESLISATFPPGSVTGAPKVRALEIIHELEPVPREAYTGAIGYRSPLAGLELNVAIRTFEFQESRVWLGSGGGITARSEPGSEYRECLVKARPLIAAIGGEIAEADAAGEDGPLPEGLRPRAAMGVFTSLMVADGLVADLAEHLARLEASTVELYGKRLPEWLLGDLAACLGERPTGRLRLTARPVGGPLQVKIEVVPAGGAAQAATLRPVLLPGGHGRHKWRDRRQLAELSARAERERALGADEHLLIVDANGDVLETDRGNIFALLDGVLCTPPLDGRLLPGVTRTAVMRLAGEAGIGVKEGPLTEAGLAGAAEVFITNSVRGLIPVRPGPVSGRLAVALAARPAEPARLARADWADGGWPWSGPQAARPEPARPEPARPEPARPEPARPEPARPEPARPEPARPEPARPEPAGLPAAAGEAAVPEAVVPEAGMPEAGMPEAVVPEAVVPGFAERDSPGPGGRARGPRGHASRGQWAAAPGCATRGTGVHGARVHPAPGAGLDRPAEGGERDGRPLVVLIDNYDSFTYNLAHLLSEAGCEVEVISNDEVEAADVAAAHPAGIVISPGPCAPAQAGISVDVIRACGATTPTLGICLGHQAIAVAYGGSVVRAPAPAHGFASRVSHDGRGALAGLPAGFPAARYHSLVVDEASLPPSLVVTARLADEPGTVMGLRHAAHPVEGLQFHPESILTVAHGAAIIGNFLRAVRR
jgi:para-aminobenzoate synthetase/4-amino-4-deoxychorismate lyase